MNQYMAKHRMDRIDIEKWDKFLKVANIAPGLDDGSLYVKVGTNESLDTSMCGIKTRRTRKPKNVRKVHPFFNTPLFNK